MFYITEITTGEINLGQEAIKQHLKEGEVFITNEVDQNAKSWTMKTHQKHEMSAQQLAQELLSQKDTGWESVRIVNSAYDIKGNLLEGMVALVGTPKKQG